MLRICYKMRHRNLSKSEGRGSGPAGRISKMRKLVTALIRHERIEGKTMYLDEARGYVELLVQQAHRHGNTHPETMELVDYWILEKDLIPKLFEVLVPRYSHSPAAVTRLHTLPIQYPGRAFPHSVLELKGNPWPPVVAKPRDRSGSLINVLLDAAKKDYRQQKYAKISEEMSKTTGGAISGSSASLEDAMEHMKDLKIDATETSESKTNISSPT